MSMKSIIFSLICLVENYIKLLFRLLFMRRMIEKQLSISLRERE
jgi:hypothetical protein